MRTIVFCLFLLLPAGLSAQAQRVADDILTAMKIEALFAIMQDEAVASGLDLGASMMPGRELSGWKTTLERLNAPARVLPDYRDRFVQALPEAQAPAVLGYLRTPLGRRIVTLELSAREALNAPGIRAAVLDRVAQMRSAGAPRIAAVDRFIAVNDLVDANVMGALSANAAFLSGLAGAGTAQGRAGRADLLADVWAQEPEIRAETQDWLTAFVALAYRPLSDAELQRHIAFSRSPAGQALNAALFDAFDIVFTRLSRETGEALARVVASEEL